MWIKYIKKSLYLKSFFHQNQNEKVVFLEQKLQEIFKFAMFVISITKSINYSTISNNSKSL